MNVLRAYPETFLHVGCDRERLRVDRVEELAIVRRARVLHMLRAHGVDIHSNSPVREITTEAVVFEQDGETQSLPAKQVIIAMGAEGDTRLSDPLESSSTAVHRIGDCKDISYIDGAILSARELVASL